MLDQNTLVHDFKQQKTGLLEKGTPTGKWTAIFIGSMILFGVFTGYLLAARNTAQVTEGKKGEGLIVGTKKVVGSPDKNTFKDNTEGVLEKGGMDGEGTHHLIREGGPSQTVYLISSVVDLDDFVGKKVRVWGETFGAEKAGWLMDVGRVEILE